MAHRAMLLALSLVLTDVSLGVAQVSRRFGVATPMRDGVKLVSDIWLPADTGRYPTILVRTPYLRGMAEFPFPEIALYFVQRGYAFAIQDVRGRGDSEGTFNFFFQEGHDGYDTIEWLARQAWSSGKVGMMGVSYLGTVQWLAAREKPPHLACIAPTAAAGRFLDEIPAIGGAFLMQWALSWLNSTSLRSDQRPNLRGVEWSAVHSHRPLLTMDSVLVGREIPLWREFLRHPTLDDYWRRIVFTPQDFASIQIPSMTTTGWFDGDQPGALWYWRGMQAHSPAKHTQYLIAGPWNHQQTFFGGALKHAGFEFGAESIVDNKALHLEFFDWCLKGSAAAPAWPRARVYVTGSNVWRDFSDYSPAETQERSLYLRSNVGTSSAARSGSLDWRKPESEQPDRYTYDPRAAMSRGGRGTGSGGGDAQRAAEQRDDLLQYTSAPLTEAVEVVGALAVELFAASDARDTDFMVRLFEVQPDGQKRKLGVNAVGAIRARYRFGRDREVLLTPGKVERYRIELYDIAHTFQPGHRIQLEVLSAVPLFNPNQNTGNPVATDTEWRRAEQTIYHDSTRPSRVILPVVPAKRAAP